MCGLSRGLEVPAQSRQAGPKFRAEDGTERLEVLIVLLLDVPRCSDLRRVALEGSWTVRRCWGGLDVGHRAGVLPVLGTPGGVVRFSATVRAGKVGLCKSDT